MKNRYKNILDTTLTQPTTINKGVRQGCPISPTLTYTQIGLLKNGKRGDKRN